MKCTWCAGALIAVLGVSLISCSNSATPRLPRQKAATRDWQKCVGFEHGLMMRCISEGLKSADAQRHQLLPARQPTDWQAPEEAVNEQNPLPGDAATIEAGKSVYSFNCQACHGDSGRGDGPAARTMGIKVGSLISFATQEKTDGALMWKITEGGSSMPSFGLSEAFSREDLWRAIHYIRTLAPAR